MNCAEALTALQEFDGVPVAVDVAITKLSTTPGMPIPSPTDLHRTHEGVLELDEEPMPSDRAVDEAIWLSSSSENRLTVRVHPGGSVPLFHFRERFNNARWDGSVLVLDVGGFECRIVRLVRPAGDYVRRYPIVQLPAIGRHASATAP
jgi:hypothetical protein